MHVHLLLASLFVAVIVDNLARSQAAANATKPKKIPGLHKAKVSQYNYYSMTSTPASLVPMQALGTRLYTPATVLQFTTSMLWLFFQHTEHESDMDLAGNLPLASFPGAW